MIPYATSMADPFLDVQLLSQGTDLINDFSEVVGGYIADLKIGDDGRIFKKPIKGGDAYLDLQWGGSIADLNLTINGGDHKGSGAKFSTKDKYGTGAYGQLWYPGHIQIKGLGPIVEDGFNTVTPDSLSADSETSQVLSLTLDASGATTAPFHLDFDIDYLKVDVLGETLASLSQGFPITDELKGDPEKVSTSLEVPIQYDSESGLVTIGKYEFSDFDFNPNLSMLWDVLYDEALKPVADWWDNIFNPYGGAPNPIEKMNENIEKQFDSGQNFAKKEVAKIITDQVNDPSVKPYVDASFLPLLKYSWNEDEYPAKFLDVNTEFDSLDDMLTGALIRANHATNSHIYEDTGRNRLKNLDTSKAARFTFFRSEDFKKKNADIITNFSKKRGDMIALSSMKFEGLEDVALTLVDNKKDFIKAKRSGSNIIAFKKRSKIQFFYDENGDKRGFGDGGIFAVLKGRPDNLPTIVESDFVII